jgi:hypothetical protein
MASSIFYYSNGSSDTSSDTTITQSSYNRSLILTGVILGDGVTNIENSSFYYSTGLTSVIFPTSSLTTIGNSGFFKSALTNVIIPNSVTGMGNSIFVNCTGLTSLTLPTNATIKTIPQGLCVSGISLTSIDIPSNYTGISQDAFIFAGLKTITLNEGLKDIGIQAFYRCPFENTLTIPDSVTVLRERAFEQTGPSSTEIEFNTIIGTGVRDILSHCFYNSKVSNISFKSPSSLDSIGPGTFALCTRLTNLYLPDSVTKIIAQSMDPNNCGVYADPPFYRALSNPPSYTNNATLRIGDNFIYPPVYIHYANKINNVCVPTYASGSLSKLADIFSGTYCANVIFGKSVTGLNDTSFIPLTFRSGYYMTFEGKMSSIGANTFKSSQGYASRLPYSGNLIFNNFTDSFTLEDNAFNFKDKITIKSPTTIRIN